MSSAVSSSSPVMHGADADRPVYITHIGFSLGEKEDLAELKELQDDERDLERMRAEGLSCFRRAGLAPWELAAGSGGMTLSAARAGTSSPRPVDVVVYCTDSFASREDYVSGPSRFLESLELSRTPLLGAGLNGCANLGPGLRIASGLVRSADASAVLVVTTDVCPEGERVMGASVSVLSDGAASCIVTSERPTSGFRMLYLESSVEAGVHRLSAYADTIAMVKATADGVKRVTRRLYERGGLGPDDFACLVTNNYGTATLRIISSVARFDFGRVFRDNVAATGHCFAADVLMNLASLQASRLRPGDKVLVLPTGHNFWTCAALEYVGPA